MSTAGTIELTAHTFSIDQIATDPRRDTIIADQQVINRTLNREAIFFYLGTLTIIGFPALTLSQHDTSVSGWYLAVAFSATLVTMLCVAMMFIGAQRRYFSSLAVWVATDGEPEQVNAELDTMARDTQHERSWVTVWGAVAVCAHTVQYSAAAVGTVLLVS